MGPFSVRSGFHPIPNFKTKNAQDAFQNYEGARSKITPKTDTTQIRLSQATYNYVEFKLELLETPSHELDDGLTAFARVRALDGETIVQKRRMVFVKGTKPETNIRNLTAGQCMHALGMPRLNLTLVVAGQMLKERDRRLRSLEVFREVSRRPGLGHCVRDRGPGGLWRQPEM